MFICIYTGMRENNSTLLDILSNKFAGLFHYNKDHDRYTLQWNIPDKIWTNKKHFQELHMKIVYFVSGWIYCMDNR